MYGPGETPERIAANPEVQPPPGVPPVCRPQWATRVGQDFVRNHNVTGIDFAAMHM